MAWSGRTTVAPALAGAPAPAAGSGPVSGAVSGPVSGAVIGPRSWFDRIWSSIADRGRFYADVLGPEALSQPLDRAEELASALLSERGEAAGAAVARELQDALARLSPEDRGSLYAHLAANFLPETERLRAAAKTYLEHSTPENASRLAEAAEPTRQELLRRMNMAPGGTASLVGIRKDVLSLVRSRPELCTLESDLKHLLSSWFNRGFLELRRIDWQTPAAILEKIIAYEAVHEITGWTDLRRRLAQDRRCFGFFHPALSGEPIIFVEVALVRGLASSIQPLLTDAAGTEKDAAADTATFYSISNCQDGLRGISFGSFLIKQVVEELKGEMPGLVRFATLSPIPGLRRWLELRAVAADAEPLLREDERVALTAALAAGMPEAEVPGVPGAAEAGPLLRALAVERWWEDPLLEGALRAPLTRACAVFLTTANNGQADIDPVARFHLGNGARLERINWLGNVAARGIRESFGLMVNYLYDPEQIVPNHEAFVRGRVIRSAGVDEITVAAAPVSATGPKNRRFQKTPALG